MITGRRAGGQGRAPTTMPPSSLAKELTADRTRALGLTPVSRETAERLDRYAALLLAWQARMNLIAASTVPKLWTRHIADSLQLFDLAPEARVWVDLGSGAGLPGLPLACALAGVSGARVHLVESNAKKAAFLREAARQLGVPAMVHELRIAEFVGQAPPGVEVVTARALAPLGELMRAAHPLLKSGVLGLFPKGQDVGVELTEAARYWSIDASLVPSRTDPRGRIVRVTRVQPVSQLMRE